MCLGNLTVVRTRLQLAVHSINQLHSQVKLSAKQLTSRIQTRTRPIRGYQSRFINTNGRRKNKRVRTYFSYSNSESKWEMTMVLFMRNKTQSTDSSVKKKGQHKWDSIGHFLSTKMTSDQSSAVVFMARDLRESVWMCEYLPLLEKNTKCPIKTNQS